VGATKKGSKDHTALREALKEASGSGQERTVVFHLRQESGSNIPSPAETEQLADTVVKRASAASGKEPKRKTVFENLGSMTVQGAPQLLLKILDQPEVAAASMNPPQGGALEPIRPVRKSPAKRSGWAKAR
jgi:hypothetical protein